MKSIKDSNILKNAGIKQLGTRTCESCGEEVPIYERGGQEISHCMVCENNRLKEQEQRNFEPKEVRQLKLRARKIENIPVELEPADFDSYYPKTDSQRQAKECAMKLVKGELQETSLVLQGKSGTGKSHLCKATGGEFRKQRNEKGHQLSVLFVDTPTLMKRIQGTYKRDSDLSEEIILQTIFNVDVLILDEVGAERSKPDPGGFETWSGDILLQIMNARQTKRNLYNTNYTSADLKQKYGEVQAMRILSRMMNRAKVIKVEGPDHRTKGFE